MVGLKNHTRCKCVQFLLQKEKEEALRKVPPKKHYRNRIFAQLKSLLKILRKHRSCCFCLSGASKRDKL